VLVSSLELANFRNYAALHFNPPSGVCIFIGANAQGKSNLLEALSLLATGKSFRAAREADLVRADTPLARVAARVHTHRGDVNAACLITRVGEGARKRFVRNGRSVPYAEFLGGIAAVTFMPHDLALVSGAPALRRRFLNAALSQLDRAYYREHAHYTKLIVQKNALLRNAGAVDRKMLATYNEQLATLGSNLICRRAAYVRRLAAEAARIHAGWVGVQPPLQIHYEPSPPQDHDESPGAVLAALAQALRAGVAADLVRRTSLVGPHRDDLAVQLGGASLARFGSQGQQRTAVLAIKAAEYALLAQATGEPPIFLLDDVLSELDAMRRRSFMESIEGCEQAFITATDVPELANVANVTVFEIQAGHIEHSAQANAS
jgi:DNA replication and repair protein RecF